MRDRSQQVYFNSGLLSPQEGGLLETTPAEARLGWPLGQSGLGTTLPLSFADCREEDVGEECADCSVRSLPRWDPASLLLETMGEVVGTHRPPTPGSSWELTIWSQTRQQALQVWQCHMQAVRTAGALCLVTSGPQRDPLLPSYS